MSDKQVLNETDRMINSGEKIKLKNGSELIVRELSLENLIKLSGGVFQIIKTVTGQKDSRKMVEGDLDPANGFAFIADIVKQPLLLEMLQDVAAATTGKTRADFNGLGLSDWLKWLNAFKKVTDWEELRELFIQLVPAGSLAGIGESLSSLRTKAQ